MARIDESDAAVAIEKWGYDLVNSEEMSGLIADAHSTGTNVYSVDDVAVWRAKSGTPHFAATIIFKGEEYWYRVLSDSIIARVEGTFRESRDGRLVVDEYTINECGFDPTDSYAADAYWESQHTG